MGRPRSGERRSTRESLAILGSAFTVFTSMMAIVGTGGVLMARDHRPAWAFVAWILGSLLEAATVVVVWRVGTEGNDPPATAFHLPRLPWVLRPIAAGWALAHFAAAAIAAVMVQAAAGLFDPAPRIVGAITFVVLGFTIIASANLYGLIAMVALGFGKRAVRTAWRWRIAVDLAVALLTAAGPSLGKALHHQVPPITRREPLRHARTTRPPAPAAAGTPRP